MTNVHARRVDIDSRSPEEGDSIETGADLAALFPADPDLMVSVEGDKRGLADVKRAARARQAGAAG